MPRSAGTSRSRQGATGRRFGSAAERRTKRSGPTHDYQDDRRGARIQKVLAEAGPGSRRACEAMVEEGRVTVNGQRLDGLPAWVNPQEDDVRVDGRRVPKPARHVYVMLFKPKGALTTTRDPEGRRLASDLVRHHSGARLYPVGRLDIDSSGLVLMTNDGELTNRLTHPRFRMPKGYEVTVAGKVTDENLAELERVALGVRRGAAPAAGKLVILKRQTDKTLLYMEIVEPANALLRRHLANVGYPVKKLRRVRLGPLKLRGLQIGEWRELTPAELRDLRALTARS